VKKALLGIAPVAAALVVAGCGGGSGANSHPKPASAKAAPQGTGAKAPAPGTAVTIAHGKLGAYLADSKGRALYLFEADKGMASTCYSACASIWPPLNSTGAVATGAGVSHTLLGTTKRTDGGSEVTYHGHPLYYYVGDKVAGSVTGQGLDQFGAKWYLIAPNGKKIDTDG
jgi:predicted lipoprotein with Yx(FWY)xxD motif